MILINDGEAQVDLVHFAIPIIDPFTKYVVFVMSLVCSDKLFARFIPTDNTPAFLSCHERAFRHFGAVPHRIFYMSRAYPAVRRKGRLGSDPELLEFAERYRFEHRPVDSLSAMCKSRLETAEYKLQQAFRRAYVGSEDLCTLEDFNRWALEWCRRVSDKRPCSKTPSRTVAPAFEEDHLRMSPLPGDTSSPDEAGQTHFDAKENRPSPGPDSEGGNEGCTKS
jgi:hypothetical protein